VHDKLYAGDGRHGQLLIVLAPEGAKVGETAEMGILHPTGNNRDGAFYRKGVSGEPTNDAANARMAEVIKLKRKAGPWGPYPAAKPRASL
jgi:hypothetical protein